MQAFKRVLRVAIASISVFRAWEYLRDRFDDL